MGYGKLNAVRRSPVALAGLLLLALAALSAHADEILVRFRDGTRPAAVRALAATRGHRVKRSLSPLNLFTLDVPTGPAAEQALSAYRRQRDVVYAEPNRRIFALRRDPNDEYYEFFQFNLEAIRAADAWDITIGDPSVVIAILDTGVALNHEDLADKSAGSYDVVPPVEGTPSQDDNGHGTAVAGVAAAATDNTIGIAGVGWNCRFLAIKILDELGEGTLDGAAEGIIYAADHGAKVINMSWGQYSTSQALQDALDYAYVKGCLLVAAMGNFGNDTPIYPAASNHVMAVAASDIFDSPTVYSSTGPHVSVTAPGGDEELAIVGPVPPYECTLSLLGYYDLSDPYTMLFGTSMSAPHVSGLAGLVWSRTPAYTADEVRAIIEHTCQDLPPGGWDQQTGWGKINAYDALSFSGPVFGTLQGTVSDQLSGNPISGATVTITQVGGPPQGTVLATGGQGGYQDAHVVTGTYKVTVSATGHVSEVRSSVAVTAGQTTILDIILPRDVGNLSGLVTAAATGLPLAGATVTAKEIGGPGQLTAQAGADGAFTFLNVPTGSYTATASMVGYLDDMETVTIIIGATTNVELALRRLVGRLVCTVTDASNSQPIARALVAALQTDGGASGAARTDYSGHCTIADLPTGTYDVTALIGGYLSATQYGVTIGPDGTSYVYFQLSATAVTLSHRFPRGWSLLSLPMTPANPSPPVVFEGALINDQLYRYDNRSLTYIGYSDITPGEFGSCQSGDGYWLVLNADTTISYVGYLNNGQQRIPLPRAGWHLIGHRIETPVALAACSVRDVNSGVTKPIREALTAGWVDLPLYGWDSVRLTYFTLGLDGPPLEDRSAFEPWAGYWLNTRVNDLELIIPPP